MRNRIQKSNGPEATEAHRSETPLRIGIFHTTLPEPGRKLGGVEVVVHRLANELARGPENAVTVYSLTPKPDGALYQHRHLFARYPWLRDNRLARIILLPFLLNFVRFDACDVLHLHGDDWFYFLRKVPTLRTLHGSALREATSATSWKRKLLQFAVFPLEHMSAKLCRLPLAVGPDAAKIYGIRHLADNGIDVQLFAPGTKLPKPRVLFVGTWEGRKRGQFLFRAFVDTILPAIPDAELCMVSDYCPEHPHVVAEVFPPDDLLAQRYREAWVFAYPSTYEGFGVAYIEAMASATAIVCTPNSGAEYVLEGGRFGVVADDGMFAQQLMDLLKDSSRRAALEATGLERATRFSWHRVAQRHREYYLAAISGDQSRLDTL